MRIKLIKSIEIFSHTFKIEYEKESGGAWFSFKNSTMGIGLRQIKSDPIYTYSIISHEVMEIILYSMGARFENTRTGENYLFNFDHQAFETAIQIHAMVMSKFIV